MDSTNTRRCPRYRMHTPVLVVVPGSTDILVPGLVSKLSRAGMEVYAGVKLDPGEVMEVEFRTEGKTVRVAGVVRNREGFCFGLEFCALRIELGEVPARG